MEVPFTRLGTLLCYDSEFLILFFALLKRAYLDPAFSCGYLIDGSERNSKLDDIANSVRVCTEQPAASMTHTTSC